MQNRVLLTNLTNPDISQKLYYNEFKILINIYLYLF